LAKKRAIVKLAQKETPVRGLTWSEWHVERPEGALGWCQCSKCGLMFPRDQFRVNPRLKSGVHSWCNTCHLERSRRWRAENRDRVNAARRAGPFEVVCRDCGETFEASTRQRVRCRNCQAAMRRARAR
jgi:hypothetical protein